MKTRIKLFTRVSVSKLEREVNSWLEWFERWTQHGDLISIQSSSTTADTTVMITYTVKD